MSELGYDVAGAGEPALLFLHGWCGDRGFFAPQFDHFSDTHRVVSVDLPGHGKSDVPQEYAIEAFANTVADLARRLRLGRSVVFGHSIGAMVALALAQETPDLVAAVALIDPPPLSKEVWKGFAAQLIPSFEGPDGPAGRRRFVEQMFLPTDDPERRDQIIETMTAVSNDIAIPLVPRDGGLRRDGGAARLHRAGAHDVVGGPHERGRGTAGREPDDDARPDGRRRPLPAARGAGAGESDDRTVPRRHSRRSARALNPTG